MARRKAGHQTEPIDWARYEHLLGTCPDAAIARLVGCTTTAVRYQRQRRRIPPYLSPTGAPWVWTPRHIALMGVLSDHELAVLAGCHPITVRRKRKALGIPPYSTGHAARGDWTDHEHRLGKEPDEDIARDMGLTRSAVCQYRQRRGIPPFKS